MNAESSPANLVIGGYDQSRLAANAIVASLARTDNLTLQVAVQGIVATNTLAGTISFSLDTGPLSMVVDSTVSQLWLPQIVCDRIAQAFGLTYDGASQLYLLNDSVHDALLNRAPELTFTVSANKTASTTTSIVFPYVAFDLQAGIPIFESNMRYFPMRQAANETQCVLGRAFLQEAYIVVDWERRNFTIGQVNHQTNDAPAIVPILPPSSQSAPPSAALSPGAIAGVVVAAVVAIAAALMIVLLLKRRSRRQWRPAADTPSSPRGSMRSSTNICRISSRRTTCY
ncbi:hypothetical protein LTR87_016410 [Friedmanniomyces endolithicus]|nr:hypothetical protein LTR75_017151 [Friedmanniomyces endolithicus]KAK0862908.1 hypothetical protein LTR87_016410 [Friedmanniomyces endolithicus]